jgi:hypothetical protein
MQRTCESEGSGLALAREQEIRAELDRLLQSPAFRTSKRCREFLDYIVEHTINGPNGALKERSIGVELFQLPKDFDTGQHTIVRVTANEVRKKLAQYYQADNGNERPVRIELPPGSYSTEFKWNEPVVETPVPVAPVSPKPKKRLVYAAIACATVMTIVAVVTWRSHALSPAPNDAKQKVLAPTPAPVGVPGGDLRIGVASSSQYIDRSGRVWGPDRFFSGGNVLVRPSERILRTLDPDIYRNLRTGDFRYDIPLQPGAYEMHLHFAETGLADFISAESSGEGQRVFAVSANGERLLTAFDVVADAAGANVADERVFLNITPSQDGFLHLAFSAMRSTAMLNAIELIPMTGGKMRPVRIRPGWTTSWQDSSGQQWRADSYFMGGNALVRRTNPALYENSIRPDLALYGSERWGHFSYALPVADGRYRVTLKFCEGHYGQRNTGVGGVGSRMFDVYCNGVALLRDFDVFKEAGGEGRTLDKVFAGIRPTAQGKIVLTFVPVRGMAFVNGIEVADDSR